ncbi:hypothetical protein, partial [Psychrobacter immobilis]|uniref:hypothetical protein n=1 Tax=Psychrobacter immobilis TaxID=498 RepID=UPI002234D984
MNSDNLYKDHTSLINDNAIKLIYRQILFTLIFLFLIVFFLYAIFNSNNNVVIILGEEISLYYL